MASQEQRKAETRQRLLDAAALLFAERGIEAVSIDTVAEAADRTSGAVYAHFGGKDGLLTALLDSLVNESAAVMNAELTLGDDGGEGDEQLAALWRTFASPPPGPSAGWMLLEHELWLYANRHDAARERLAARFAEVRRIIVDSTADWEDAGRADPPGTPDQVSQLLIALLVGLEMQHRLDPDAISDETAVLGLRAVTGLRHPDGASTDAPPGTSEPSPPPTPRTPRRKTPTRRTS